MINLTYSLILQLTIFQLNKFELKMPTSAKHSLIICYSSAFKDLMACLIFEFYFNTHFKDSFEYNSY